MARRSRVSFRPTTVSDIEYLAANLREADIQEMHAAHGKAVNVRHLIFRSVGCTPDCRTVLLESGDPVAIYGIGMQDGISAGIPWLLGTEKASQYARELVIYGKELVERGLKHHPVLFNYIDARHTDSIRWLKHIGFTIGPAQPHGAYGMPFHLFHVGSHGTHGAEAPH